jgi:hypothetical protein
MKILVRRTDHETRRPPTQQMDVFHLKMVGATGRNPIVPARLDYQSE